MDRRKFITTAAATVLPLGLTTKAIGYEGIWGTIGVTYNGNKKQHLHVLQEQCVNDFARRALELHPELANAEYAFINFWFGKVARRNTDAAWAKFNTDARLPSQWLDCHLQKPATFCNETPSWFKK